VKPLVSIAVISATIVMQGCATSTHLGGEDSAARAFSSNTNEVSPIALAPDGKKAVNGAAVGVTKDVPLVEGHPLTAVVVTQCNLVVAVYMTMQDGRLLRFDSKANVPAEQLVTMAYTATRSERVEVSCEGTGVAGYETHVPT
jgi:hypothetical protein